MVQRHFLRRIARVALALLSILIAVPAAAQLADDGVRDPLFAGDLRAGQYLWLPERSPTGPIDIVVTRPKQLLFVYRGGVPIGAATVSTGKPGHRTPLGRFTILQKAVRHRSNLYSNAPMPYMQRLTWGGIALHAGYNPGRPASHGCIRMPYAFARLLYGVTQVGATVLVTDGVPVAVEPPMDLVPTIPLRRPAPTPFPETQTETQPQPQPVAPMIQTVYPAPDPSVSVFDDMVSYTM